MSRNRLIVAGAIVLVVLLLGLLGGGMMGAGMMGWGGGGWGMGWGMGTGWGLVMLLFWVLIIGGLVWLLNAALGGSRPASGSDVGRSRPLDILRERYARGEITRDEYEQMHQDLQD